MRPYPAKLVVAIAACAALSACEPPPPGNQQTVVAKVGGVPISEAELNQALSRLGQLNEADAMQARGKMLDALIDQRLVSNAAQKAKLDKIPEIAMALQQAQRQILAEAYMERVFKDLPKPADAEINDYYSRHPELFSARKIYRLQELQLKVAPGRLPELEAELKRSRNLADFANWLKEQGIEGQAGQVVKPAEQIPGPILARIKSMADGEVTLQVAEPDRLSVLQLQGSQLQPLSLEQARDAIEQVLIGEKRKTLLDVEIKKLRDTGKIEYASGFVPKEQPASAGTAAESPPKP
jgi:EpsD family peptidyl-prolyl cis-trans isomerase